MEEKKSSLNAILIIFIILTIVLGGYVAYDKLLNKNDNSCPKCDNLETNQNSTENRFSTFKNNFIANRNKSMVKNNKGVSYFTYMDEYVYVDENGNLFYTDINGKEIKIASNVLLYNFLHVGNGDWNYLYLIKEDGTVSTTNVYIIDNDGELHIDGSSIKVEDNYKGYKNIIAFLDGTVDTCKEICDGAGSPSFVDINGNIYNSNL